ncbi:MAG: hypothetical protein VX589_21105 [Myxococcota bacterium]|nr:hypothetical protein [Myxococcota bacterium]
MNLFGEAFVRWHGEAPWAGGLVEGLALKYDTVEGHGWYDNLDPTVDLLAEELEPGAVLIDYSGGTGILAQRLIERRAAQDLGIVIVDSSPKFLRLALEKFRDNQAVAFRHIQYIKAEKRLQTLDETARWSLLPAQPAALVSTNAIHLYYGLHETIRSWWRVLGPGASLYVQSGNIANPDAPDGTWIIDETVEHIHRISLDLAHSDPEFASYRSVMDDQAYMNAHTDLRKKYFLPVRPLSTYVEAIEGSGFRMVSAECRPIQANVEDWYRFLSVYHEGVVGWMGGAKRITGTTVDERVKADRLTMMRRALDILFEGHDTFDASWTYLKATRLDEA